MPAEGRNPGERDAELEASILELLAERGRDKTICPSEAARAVGGRGPAGRRETASTGVGGFDGAGAGGGAAAGCGGKDCDHAGWAGGRSIDGEGADSAKAGVIFALTQHVWVRVSQDDRGGKQGWRQGGRCHLKLAWLLRRRLLRKRRLRRRRRPRRHLRRSRRLRAITAGRGFEPTPGKKAGGKGQL